MRAPFDIGRLEPLNEDHTVNQALEFLLGQTVITHQVNDILGQSDITWTSVFVDPGIVCTAPTLSLKIRLRPYINRSSPYRAMHGLMPHEAFTRVTKGEHTGDLYKTFFARRGFLVDESARRYVG